MRTLRVRSDPAQHPVVGGSRLTAVPYLAWCLSGSARWASTAGPALEITPGSAVLARPHSFVNIQHTGPVRLLRLGCEPSGLVIGENRITAVQRGARTGVLTLHACGVPPDPFVSGLIRRLQERGDGPGGPALLQALLDELIDILQRLPGDAGVAQQRYRHLLAYLREHLEEELDRSCVARVLGCSPDWISRLCRRYGGGGFQDVLRELRLRRAEQLLSRTALPVRAIARHCGFSSANYCAQVFRQLRGCSPRQWRARATQL
ncbi:MAG: helix-turn-helix domain-containing protein [Planctomycetota bacterium]